MTDVATEGQLHRRARKLARLADEHGIGDLYCGGDGTLLSDLDADLPHFTVAQFCAEAEALVGGQVELLSTTALAGHRVPEQLAHPHHLNR